MLERDSSGFVSKNVRILLTIHHSLTSNTGAPGATLNLVSAIRTHGQEVKTFSHDNLPRWARGKAAIFLFPFFVAWHGFRVRKATDLIDATSYDGWLVSLLPRSLRPKRLVFSTHGLEHLVHQRFKEDVARGRQKMSWKYIWYRGSVHLWLVALAARRADFCLFLNAEELNYSIRYLGVLPCRAALASNGLKKRFLCDVEDLQSLNGESERQADVGRGLSVVFIGSYISRKGVSYLATAMNEYLLNNPRATLSLLGVGASVEKVKASFSSGILERIQIVSSFQPEELPSLLVGHDVFVLPSLSEGFSIAGLEAMACGLVPILSRHCGFESYAEDNLNALFVDRADAAQIVSALERLTGNPSELQAMRQAAILSARAFTWEAVAAKRLVHYQRLLTGGA